MIIIMMMIMIMMMMMMMIINIIAIISDRTWFLLVPGNNQLSKESKKRPSLSSPAYISSTFLRILADPNSTGASCSNAD